MVFYTWRGDHHAPERPKAVEDDLDANFVAWIAFLTEELELVLRTFAHIKVWNKLVAERFPCLVSRLYFRYAPRVGQHLDSMARLRLNPCVLPIEVSSTQVEARTSEPELPRRALPVEYEVLEREIYALTDELQHLVTARSLALGAKPGGHLYRLLLREHAQQGQTRYHLRPASRKRVADEPGEAESARRPRQH
jgi:hypothetical protein